MAIKIKVALFLFRIFLILAPDHNFLSFYFLILERGGERQRETDRQTDRQKETSICCFTYWCMHWLIIVCALTRGWTHNLSISGWSSNQLSYPARTWSLLSLCAEATRSGVWLYNSKEVLLCMWGQLFNFIWVSTAFSADSLPIS